MHAKSYSTIIANLALTVAISMMIAACFDFDQCGRPFDKLQNCTFPSRVGLI